jgi:hypothetical protein
LEEVMTREARTLVALLSVAVVALVAALIVTVSSGDAEPQPTPAPAATRMTVQGNGMMSGNMMSGGMMDGGMMMDAMNMAMGDHQAMMDHLQSILGEDAWAALEEHVADQHANGELTPETHVERMILHQMQGGARMTCGSAQQQRQQGQHQQHHSANPTPSPDA